MPPFTHTHGGHIILVGLSNFLHDLLLRPAAVLNGPLHGDGPLGVIESEVLEPGRRAGQRQAVGKAGLDQAPARDKGKEQLSDRASVSKGWLRYLQPQVTRARSTGPARKSLLWGQKLL